jgi:hypothetical protein
VSTDCGNTNTLKINPGDVLKVSITDPSQAAFTTTIEI